MQRGLLARSNRWMIPLAVAAAAIGGCEQQNGDAAATDQDTLAQLTAEHGEPVKTYTVRGEVEALPDPEQVGTDFIVHHEAIDDFLNAKGEVVGMSAMSMPFPLADGLELPEGLEVGDKVEFSFAQWLEPRLTYIVYEVEELPADTDLTFRAANPPASDDASPSDGNGDEGPN